ncbi:MAG: alkaline phosphatase family protein [Betaproteobacteria bacterium]
MPLPAAMIFVFDALRRDMITSELAPHLREFIDGGSDFPSSRCVFPSVTRVNATALSCGATPGATGVIANKFYDAAVFPNEVVHTGLYDHIQAAERAYGNRFVSAVTLGDVLGAHGMKLAVVSTGSAGTTHLLDPRAASHGHVRLCLSDWRASCPAQYAGEILQRFGPIPAAAKPNVQRIALQTRIALEAVLPDVQPDVLIMWFSDPDSTYHYCGIGSPESREAIRNADRQFGRVLEVWRSAPDRDRCQIFVCSDHGQVTARERIHVKQQMRESGLPIGPALTADHAYAGSTGYHGAIRVRSSDAQQTARLARWLLEQPWCGHVFTPGGDGVHGSVPGTLDRSMLLLGETRAPDVYYTMRSDGAPNAWDVPGSCFFDSSEVPVGGGVHGGLNVIEMNNLLAAQGSLFRNAYRSPWPASQTDIVPTLLHALELPRPPTATGRVLGEALVERGFEPPAAESAEVSAEAGSVRHCVKLWRVGATRYIDHGWTEGGGT